MGGDRQSDREGDAIAAFVTVARFGEIPPGTGPQVQDPIVGVSRHETRIVGDEVQVRRTD